MGPYLSAPNTEKRNSLTENEQFAVAVAEMQGWRMTMEDASLVNLQLDADTALFGVFDGHGGKEVAHFVVKYMAQDLLSSPQYQAGDFAVALRETFLGLDVRLLSPAGNREIQLMINDLPEDTEVDTSAPFDNRGCTAVVALFRGGKVYVANAGDSRCVLCRGGTAIDLSEDHKPEMPEERTRIENAGGTIENGRVNGGLNLSRSIGDLDYKRVAQLKAEEQMISALPEVKELELGETDEFLVLACDGVWEQFSSQDTVSFLQERLKTDSLEATLNALLDRCLAESPSANEGKGCDNMTAVLIKLK